MGFKYRKTIKIMPGVRLTLSPSGISTSAGVRGARITRSANGRVTRTLSVPGSGLSHSKTIRPATSVVRRSAGGTAPSTHLAPPPPPPKPGMLAPAAEKALFAAIGSGRPDGFTEVASGPGATDPALRVLCASLEGLWHFARLDGNSSGDAGRARELLGWVAANDPDAAARHPLAGKYAAELTWPVEVAHGVVAELHLTDDVAVLAAAELHQAAGDLAAAIWCVESAEPTAIAALSLAELYSQAGRHQDVIDVTNGVDNGDDATALLLVLRGRAFAQVGYYDAARESFKDAMRIRSRAMAVRHRALLERAEVNLAQNKKAAARKDLETVLADNPAYPGLSELLVTLV